MKRLILIAVVLSVGISLAGWRGRFDEQFAAASTAEWTPASLSPIAWYKLNGDGKDSSGNGYDCTWGGTEAYADGVTGQAASFNGASSLSGPKNTLSDSTVFTMSAFIKTASTEVGDPIVGKRIVTIHRLRQSTKTAISLFGSVIGVRTGNVKGSIIVNDNAWHHVVGVHDNSEVKIYVDGILDVAGSDELPSGLYDINIGSYRTTDGLWLGQIDDVLIFDRALTPLEISTLYHESAKRNGEAW